jgi:putative transposase
MTVRLARGERGIWQRRYWEHAIRDDLDLQRHIDYIHHNPVKHGWVGRAVDWPHSSFRQYVLRGIYSEEWANGQSPIGAVADSVGYRRIGCGVMA